MNPHGIRHVGPIGRMTRGLLLGAVALLAATALLYWSWNTALAEVFGAPSLEPRSALALVLLALLLRAAARGGMRRHRPRDATG